MTLTSDTHPIALGSVVAQETPLNENDLKRY